MPTFSWNFDCISVFVLYSYGGCLVSPNFSSVVTLIVFLFLDFFR